MKGHASENGRIGLRAPRSKGLAFRCFSRICPYGTQRIVHVLCINTKKMDFESLEICLNLLLRQLTR